MKRKLIIAALALGTVGGFGAGFASLRCRRAMWKRHHVDRMEQKVTDICAKAVKKAQAKQE